MTEKTVKELYADLQAAAAEQQRALDAGEDLAHFRAIVKYVETFRKLLEVNTEPYTLQTGGHNAENVPTLALSPEPAPVSAAQSGPRQE
ncbi:MAG: hypothetical protein IKK75_13700 [Clostridia bacterium]|nr:hypothetical protein [Clostridia bacterium]